MSKRILKKAATGEAVYLRCDQRLGLLRKAIEDNLEVWGDPGTQEIVEGMLVVIDDTRADLGRHFEEVPHG